MGAGVRLRGGQESPNHLQNIRIAPRSMIESRCIDESHHLSVESELICELNLGRTRLQAHPDP